MWRKTCEARAEWYYSDRTDGAEEKPVTQEERWTWGRREKCILEKIKYNEKFKVLGKSLKPSDA